MLMCFCVKLFKTTILQNELSTTHVYLLHVQPMRLSKCFTNAPPFSKFRARGRLDYTPVLSLIKNLTFAIDSFV